MQAGIAAQAYVIGRAFQLCGVPVRISAYSTIRNRTVLRFFNDCCSSRTSTELKNVFRYYAAGFNRDGLALSAAGAIVEHGLPPQKPGPVRKRALLVLTDAAPMDEAGSYVGRPAVTDTAAQVRVISGTWFQSS